MYTPDIEITTVQANKFDQCVSELSPEAQDWFAEKVDYISNRLGKGAGIKSAKSLLFQLMFYAEQYNITTATLLTR